MRHRVRRILFVADGQLWRAPRLSFRSEIGCIRDDPRLLSMRDAATRRRQLQALLTGLVAHRVKDEAEHTGGVRHYLSRNMGDRMDLHPAEVAALEGADVLSVPGVGSITGQRPPNLDGRPQVVAGGKYRREDPRIPGVPAARYRDGRLN